MTKEIVRPASADKALFFLGPASTVGPSLAAWAVIPFGPEIATANLTQDFYSHGHHVNGGVWRDHFRVGIELNAFLWRVTRLRSDG